MTFFKIQGTDKIYDGVIKRHFSDYMGLVYEQMCKEYLFLYALGTTVDYLLGANVQSSTPILKKEIADLLEECSSRELNAMIETMRFVRKMTIGFSCKD